MRIRDLFAGYYAHIYPFEGRWCVGLIRQSGDQILLSMYVELPEAIEAVHDLALMLVDDTRLVPDVALIEKGHEMLREAIARHALGESLRLPQEETDLVEESRLRDWFEREMGGPRT